MFNITNFGEHPTNPHFIVFRYKTSNEFDLFKQLLGADEIDFEAEQHIDDNNKETYLVAVKSGNQKVAIKHNYLTMGKFRKRTFKDKKWIWATLVITLALLGTAVVGFFKS